jgi:CheY-like chemotaxis protein
MRRFVWGIDIGGTKCALVSGNDAGEVLLRREIRTRDYACWREVLDALFEVLPEQSPEAVGISCGGPLDANRGLILSPPNLPGWDEVPICEVISDRFGVPSFLQNDANACALAEWKFGAGRGSKNMVFLTFGTGFGAGLILDGRLYSGTNDMAGEIGHVRCAEDGPVGIRKAKETKPDVILCDIGLPGISGYEVAEKILNDEELKDTFMIALSGYAQQRDIERSKEAGFRRHLAKPVQLDILKMALSEAAVNVRLS